MYITNMYITRKEILNKAYHDCMCELYAKSQPMADYDNLVAELKAGKIDEEKDGPVHDRHYISKEELEYVVNKYIDAYGMTERWRSYIETLEYYLNNGGTKKKGKDYEDVAPLKEHIHDILNNTLSGINLESSTKEITDKVMELIKNCKDFYKFDNEAEIFRAHLYLGAVPSTNKDTVKDWWKEHYNTDIEIEDRNPKLFWYRDNDYTDEDLEYEFDDPNWKENLDKQWKEEVAEKKRLQEERYKELEKQLQEMNKQNGKQDS